ncbi:MAG: DUF5915 domain-containing protein, partial [Patescibacteria group bacterium]
YNFSDENKSVHLESWPKQSQITDSELEILKKMQMVKKIVELGLAKRDKAGIKVRQPLRKLLIFSRDSAGQSLITEYYLNLIKDELNVKEIIMEKGSGELKVELDTVISDDLKLEGLKREIARKVNMARKQTGLTIKDKIILHWQSNGNLVANVFSKFNEEIKKETLSAKIINSNEKKLIGKKIKVNNEGITLFIEKI